MGWLWEFARDGPERPANPKTFPALASTSTTSTSPRYRLSLLILRVGKHALPINPWYFRTASCHIPALYGRANAGDLEAVEL
jgi:hypothetical protein